ncbi:unnamed protein product [Microthlaspi erraticum]|uniref:Uncharacterized protein n=1 Tax=Microthlaspi erraticum TaxID=1685480 RepID=A0A6D2JQ48_9BRAS|nr:unnamed protein product [Microthlaspi erraticum]
MGHSLHPFLAYGFLHHDLDFFEVRYKQTQTIFSSKEKCEKILDMISDEGRVCVPIDPKKCDEFDPLAVPTLSQLIEEINSGGLKMDVDDYAEPESERSLLVKSVSFFRSSFLEPLLKSCKEDIESSYKTKIDKTKDSFSCMASSPRETWAADLEKIKRKYREFCDREAAQANRRALLALLFGKPKEDGYGPAGLVTRTPKERRCPVEKMLHDGVRRRRRNQNQRLMSKD